MTDQSPPQAGQFHHTTGTVYQIRIDLKGARPPIWRRLLVPADTPLDILHNVLQVAMGWQDAHFHAYEQNGVPIESLRGPEPSDQIDEADVVLSEVLFKVGDKLNYDYDFDNGWEHVLKLEKILPLDPEELYPICTAGRRACPPEGVGGLSGYADFLAALADPTHPEHEACLEWIGGDYDPEAFDPEDVTEALQGILDDPDLPLHALSIARWQMMSPAVTDMMLHTIPTYVATPLPNHQQAARQLQEAQTAQDLLDLMPVGDPLLLEAWMARICSLNPKEAVPLVAQRMVELSASDDEKSAWLQDRLALVLHRLGLLSVPAILNVFDQLDDYGRALACVLLGQFVAVQAADRIWQTFEEMVEGAESGLFLGPLWALIDLEDPRAADAVVRALEDDWLFTEISAMTSRAGDRRAVKPLLEWMILSGPEPESPLMDALTVVGHRIGRRALLQEIAQAMQFDDEDADASPEDLVELILSTPVYEARATFRAMFDPTTPEDLAAEFDDWLDDEDDEFFNDDWLFDDDKDDDELELLVPPYISGLNPFSLLSSKSAPFESRPRLGRNDPCWCGSGKPYKDCHWRQDRQKDMPQAA